ncbi:MAG: hypothetical protein ACKVQB_00550, partial [Bacteroidia bacterium]
ATVNMPLNKTIKRELEVAISKHSQPVWFRIMKYIVLGILIYLLWGSLWLWIVLGVLLIFSLSLHFCYRYKTAGWSKSYGMWNYEKNKPKE